MTYETRETLIGLGLYLALWTALTGGGICAVALARMWGAP